jgi:hypothetical protein
MVVRGRRSSLQQPAKRLRRRMLTGPERDCGQALPGRKRTLKSEIRNPKFAMVSFDWSFFYESTVRSD